MIRLDRMVPRERYLSWAHSAERGIYWTVGIVLTLAAAVFLAHTVWQAATGYLTGEFGATTLRLFDRALIALMLAQIVYTTLTFLREGVLQVESVLVVGIIAVVRRILVVTAMVGGTLAPSGPAAPTFEQAMLEIGLLAATVLVLALAVFLLRLQRRG